MKAFIHKLKFNKQKIFFWSLAFVLMTLPFPKYDIHSKSIIICGICWLFYSSFREKLSIFKTNLKVFLILSSLFWISIFGLLYTDNMEEGINMLRRSLPFLIFPLIFSTTDIRRQEMHVILKYFSYSVIIASSFAIIKALYFKFNNLGEYFYYSDFALVMDKHTTYFAIFVLVAIAYFLSLIMNNKRTQTLIYLVPIFYLLGILYLLSVRVSIISLVCISLFLLIMHWKKMGRLKQIIFAFGVVLSLFSFLTPNFEKRFSVETPEGIEISDYYSRKTHWEAVVSAISKSNLFIGAGSGDGHRYLFEEYENFNFKTGFENKYNAHNQYLETVLFYGLIGLGLMLFILFIALRINLRDKNYLVVSILFTFMIFMLTESILLRQSGISIFAFIVACSSFSYQTKEIGNIIKL